MDNRVAILSDIHSNIEALEAVLRDIDKKGITRIICCGDIVGYGPDPVAVVKKAMGFEFSVRGNHDEAVLTFASKFHEDAAKAADWTRKVLKEGPSSSTEGREIIDFLQKTELIKQWDQGSVLFLHGSPRAPLMEYVRPKDEADPAKLKSIFSRIRQICFYGHSHEPGFFTDKFKWTSPSSLPNGKAKIEFGTKYMINVGSVGQPRDGDTRAGYVIFDWDTVTFCRVEYDYKKTMQKVFAIPQIPRKFGDRLAIGR